jgi:hypothetical protein
MSKWACFVCILCFYAVPCDVAAQQQQMTVTITEPAPVKAEKLFKHAELVADVRILSGDTEHYPRTVYKSEVLRPFKGVSKGAVIYFGPFVGYGLGEELIVFLDRSPERLKPYKNIESGLSYGQIPSFYVVMYQGYAALQVKYDCLFDGAESAQRCDYGVRVNTYQLRLPRSVKTFPSSARGAFSENTNWVRKSEFVAYLERLAMESCR